MRSNKPDDDNKLRAFEAKIVKLQPDASAIPIPFINPRILSSEQSTILEKNPLDWSDKEVKSIQALFLAQKASLKMAPPHSESNEYYYAICIAELLMSRIEYFQYRNSSGNKPALLVEEIFFNRELAPFLVDWHTIFKKDIGPFSANWHNMIIVQSQTLAREESGQLHHTKPNMKYVAFLAALNLLGATLLLLGALNIWNPLGWIFLGALGGGLMLSSTAGLIAEKIESSPGGEASIPALLGLFIPLINFFVVQSSAEKVWTNFITPRVRGGSTARIHSHETGLNSPISREDIPNTGQKATSNVQTSAPEPSARPMDNPPPRDPNSNRP